jgi:hypothetical protein
MTSIIAVILQCLAFFDAPYFDFYLASGSILPPIAWKRVEVQVKPNNTQTQQNNLLK